VVVLGQRPFAVILDVAGAGAASVEGSYPCAVADDPIALLQATIENEVRLIETMVFIFSWDAYKFIDQILQEMAARVIK